MLNSIPKANKYIVPVVGHGGDRDGVMFFITNELSLNFTLCQTCASPCMHTEGLST